MYEMLLPSTGMEKRRPEPLPQQGFARMAHYGLCVFTADAARLMALQKNGSEFLEYHALISLGHQPGRMELQISPGPAPDADKLKRVYASANSVFVPVYPFLRKYSLEVGLYVDCPVFISHHVNKIVVEVDITPALMAAGS